MTENTLPHGIDIIVCNYRTPADLGHCLASLDRHRPTVPWRLAVVNVDPLDEDESVALYWQTQMRAQMAFVKYRENVGYATAVNGAAHNRGYDTLGIFNADVRFMPDVIDDCFQALHSHDEWGVLGPRQIDDTNRITHGGIFEENGRRCERGFHQRDRKEYADIRDDVAYVAGSAMFIKRDVWDVLTSCPKYQDASPGAEGGLLPTPLFYEDTYLCLHLAEHPELGKTVYYGAAYMIHNWHRSVSLHKGRRFLGQSREQFLEACSLHGIEASGY